MLTSSTSRIAPMHREELSLIEPTEALQAEYEAYCREFAGVSEIPGSGSMATSDAFAEGVRRCLEHGQGRNLPEGWVPAHTFWLVRNARTLIGLVDLRHALTPSLEREGGHIGYSVRPTEQRKGYATRMLSMTLEKARQLGLRRVLITCDKKNVASARVIQKCGGVLENEIPSCLPGRETTQRYWINL